MNMVCNSAQLVFDTRNSTKGSGGIMWLCGSGWQPEFTDGCVEVAAMKAD